MTHRRTNPRTVGVAAAMASALTLPGAEPAEAGDRNAQHLAAQFAPVGLAGGETLRINVVAIDVPDDQLPRTSCPVIFRLFDKNGDEVASDETSIEPGEAAHVDYSIASRERPALRPQVVFPRRCSGILSSIEIYDTETGALHAIVAPSGALEQVDIEEPDRQ